MEVDETVKFVVVDTEEINLGALRLYSSLGFICTKSFFNYYQTGTSGIRLKLYFERDQELSEPRDK